MIPLKDENSTLSTPLLSYAIIGICVVVFLIQISSSGFDNGHLFYSYGVVPTSLLGIEPLPNDLNKIDPYLTLITSTINRFCKTILRLITLVGITTPSSSNP